MGQSPLVCSLLAGVFNKRPPQPRYTSIWDVDQVITFLKGLPAHKDLSDKEITLKLTVLLALTAASRCSEIKYLKLSLWQNQTRNIVSTFFS